MDLHISLFGRRDLCGEIFRQVRRAILEGRLRPGDPLPPSRILASKLSVSRTTVTVAYDRLASEGYVKARVGAGTFVSEYMARPPVPETPGRGGVLQPRSLWNGVKLSTAFVRRAQFDLRTGLPDASLFPHPVWRRMVLRALRADHPGAGLYGEPAGYRPLREAIARHVGVACGIDVTADDVTITSGTQQAFDIIGRVLLAPGDVVAVEDPGYGPARQLFASLGARIAGVPVDRDGLIVEALPRRARLVYVTPAHQYPLGAPLALSRRRALLEWAERENAAIMEDAYDSEFRFAGRPMDTLRILDTTGRVIYVASYSKTMLPSLRLGFVLTPPSLRDAVHRAKYLADWHTSTLLQAPLARFIDDGLFARHVRRAGAVYRERRTIVIEALHGRGLSRHLELIPSTSGLHVAALSRSGSVRRLAKVAGRASELGVELQTLDRFAVGRQAMAGIAVGYGAIRTDQLPEALRRLRQAFDG